jgi:hypothetical protein
VQWLRRFSVRGDIGEFIRRDRCRSRLGDAAEIGRTGLAKHPREFCSGVGGTRIYDPDRLDPWQPDQQASHSGIETRDGAMIGERQLDQATSSRAVWFNKRCRYPKVKVS